MRYWPFSFIKNSPLIPPAYANEVCSIEKWPTSQGAYYAAVDVARQTPPLHTPNLAVIESVDAPLRRIYKARPAYDEWARLERGGFLEDDQGTVFGFWDGLH